MLFTWSSVQFGHSVMSDSLQPHGLQHSRLPCPSPTQSLLKLIMFIESVMHRTISSCCPLLEEMGQCTLSAYDSLYCSGHHSRWVLVLGTKDAQANKMNWGIQFSSVQLLSRVWLFATPWIAACQASGPSPTPGVHSNSRPSSRWCHPAMSSSVIPFSSCPQSLPASEILFQWVHSSHEVAEVLEFQL